MTQQNWLNRQLTGRLAERAAVPSHLPPRKTQLSLLLATGLLLSLAACTSPVEPSALEPSATPTAPSASDSAPAEPAGQPESAVTPDNPDTASQAGSSSPVAQAPNQAAPNRTAPTSCDNPQTQQAMNRCAQQSYVQADAELNQVYQAVKAQQPSSGQQALTSAEVAWLSFRDLDCEFERSQFEGGSMAPMIYSGCLNAQTRTRTAELRQPALPNTSYQAADAQLNQTYQSLMAILEKGRSNALVEAQMAWLEYRDRNCNYEVLYSPTVIEETQCLARMSATRTEQLKQNIEQSSL